MAFRMYEWVLNTWGWSIPIPGYFPLLGIGFIAGVYMTSREAQRMGIDVRHILNMSLYASIGILVGARLFVALPRLDYYLAHPKALFLITEAGLASHGGFLAGLAIIIAYTKYRGLPLLTLSDALPAGFGIGLFFTRIGCLLEGSCYGVVTQLPWGVRFPEGSIAYRDLFRGGLVSSGPSLTPALHPTQLYAAAAGLCLMVLALWWAPRKRFDGEVFFGGLLFYAATRIVIDALRGDLVRAETLFFGFLPTAQLITALLGIVGMLGLGYLSQRFKRAEVEGHLA